MLDTARTRELIFLEQPLSEGKSRSTLPERAWGRAWLESNSTLKTNQDHLYHSFLELAQMVIELFSFRAAASAVPSQTPCWFMAA